MYDIRRMAFQIELQKNQLLTFIYRFVLRTYNRALSSYNEMIVNMSAAHSSTRKKKHILLYVHFFAEEAEEEKKTS